MKVEPEPQTSAGRHIIRSLRATSDFLAPSRKKGVCVRQGSSLPGHSVYSEYPVLKGGAFPSWEFVQFVFSREQAQKNILLIANTLQKFPKIFSLLRHHLFRPKTPFFRRNSLSPNNFPPRYFFTPIFHRVRRQFFRHVLHSLGDGGQVLHSLGGGGCPPRPASARRAH